MKSAGRNQQINDFFNAEYAWWQEVYDDGLPRGFFSFEMIRRKEILLDLLRRLTAGKPSLRILECGCGPGGILGDIRAEGHHLTGVDINFDYLTRTRSLLGPRGDLSLADVERLPFKAGSFDIVYCVGVLSYLEQDRRAVEEICRVTKPEGSILISLPNLLTFNKIADPYYYLFGPILLVWRRLKMKHVRKPAVDQAFQTSMIRRYRFSQLDRLYAELGLKKGQTLNVSFGPPTLWRKEILSFRFATRLSGFLTQASQTWGLGFLRYFANHWITCLRKPALSEE